jgi:hypothetical protein
VGIGVLGWMPEVFWRATVFDLVSGIEGFMEKSGAGTIGPRSKLSASDVEKLMELAHDGG